MPPEQARMGCTSHVVACTHAGATRTAPAAKAAADGHGGLQLVLVQRHRRRTGWRAFRQPRRWAQSLAALLLGASLPTGVAKGRRAPTLVGCRAGRAIAWCVQHGLLS